MCHTLVYTHAPMVSLVLVSLSSAFHSLVAWVGGGPGWFPIYLQEPAVETPKFKPPRCYRCSLKLKLTTTGPSRLRFSPDPDAEARLSDAAVPAVLPMPRGDPHLAGPVTPRWGKAFRFSNLPGSYLGLPWAPTNRKIPLKGNWSPF